MKKLAYKDSPMKLQLESMSKLEQKNIKMKNKNAKVKGESEKLKVELKQAAIKLEKVKDDTVDLAELNSKAAME